MRAGTTHTVHSWDFLPHVSPLTADHRKARPMTLPASDDAPASTPATPPPGQAPRKPVGLLRDPGFRRYWGAQTVSRLGDQISGLAIPLVAVTVIHADTAQMGYLGAAAWLPHLLIGVYAGLWADRRRHRRRVMIAADLGRFVLLVTIPVTHALGALTLGHLYVVAFASGTLSVFFEVCNPPVFKALVPPSRYVAGNSLVSGNRAMAKVVGPSIAGFLVQLFSAPFALLADAVSYLGSALFLSRIAPVEAPPSPRERAQLRTAGRFMARSRPIRAALAATASVNFFSFAVTTLFVLYATEALHLGPDLLGTVLGAGAIGAVVGAVCATPLTRRIGVGRVFLLGCVMMPAPLLLIPAAAGSTALVVAMLVAAEFGSALGVMWIDVTAATLLTRLVPDDMRSRVFGAYQAVNLGTRPLAALVAGTVAGSLGMRTTLWIAVAGALTSFLWVLPSPLMRRQLPEAAQEL
ncbi:MFS transporter [Streptomyces sp. NPDC001286]